MPRCGVDKTKDAYPHLENFRWDIAVACPIPLLRKFTVLLLTGKAMILPELSTELWEKTADAVSWGLALGDPLLSLAYILPTPLIPEL